MLQLSAMADLMPTAQVCVGIVSHMTSLWELLQLGERYVCIACLTAAQWGVAAVSGAGVRRGERRDSMMTSNNLPLAAAGSVYARCYWRMCSAACFVCRCQPIRLMCYNRGCSFLRALHFSRSPVHTQTTVAGITEEQCFLAQTDGWH